MRQPVAVIYRFARTADDFADEGDAAAGASGSALLDAYRAGTDAHRGAAAAPARRCFADSRAVDRATIDLPLQLFHDLLDAFRQDVVKTRYADFAELMDYCRRSANPVGRLLLHLFGAATRENLARSDAICTSLQLINFWQDVGSRLAQGPRLPAAGRPARASASTEAQIAAGDASRRAGER